MAERKFILRVEEKGESSVEPIGITEFSMTFPIADLGQFYVDFVKAEVLLFEKLFDFLFSKEKI